MRMKRTLKIWSRTLKRMRRFPWNDLAELGRDIAITLLTKGFTDSSGDREQHRKIQRLGERTYQFYLDNRERFPYRIRTFLKKFQDLQHHDPASYEREPHALPYAQEIAMAGFEQEPEKSSPEMTDLSTEETSSSLTTRLEIELNITGLTPDDVPKPSEEKPQETPELEEVPTTVQDVATVTKKVPKPTKKSPAKKKTASGTKMKTAAAKKTTATKKKSTRKSESTKKTETKKTSASAKKDAKKTETATKTAKKAGTAKKSTKKTTAKKADSTKKPVKKTTPRKTEKPKAKTKSGDSAE